VGNVVIDHLVVLPGHPEADTKTAVVSDHMQVGGPVPTALALLSRFGHPCSFIGSWSSDAFGSFIEADFHREEIDTQFCLRRNRGRTGFAHVWVDQQTAARTIAHHRTSEFVEPDEITEEPFQTAKALHLDGWPGETAIKAAELAGQHGCQVFLDTGSPKPGMEQLIRKVDVLNCPRRFLYQFLGTHDIRSGVQQLLNMGPTMVTVTSGNEGAVLATRDEWIERPAYKVEVCDTTGAGDVFCGGLIHAVLEKRPLEQTLAFAMAAAALKCKGIGNRAALPDQGNIDNLVRGQTPSILTSQRNCCGN
jgi:sugar/nucleoside kinase (ribokinase family)